MTPLAEDMRAGMLGDRVVAGQKDRPARHEAFEDRRHKATRQVRERPAIA
jgi:hypothetical protein